MLVDAAGDFAIEREASHRNLFRLKEIKSRHLYAKLGYPNMFSMLIKHFKQSEASAYQRMKAIDLMLDVPAVEERLASGDLNMSTVAMAQRQIKREEKITGKEVSPKKKAEIVDAITNKTMAQTEVELFKQLPETASQPEETEQRVSADVTRMGINVPDDVLEMMNRLKDLWAHVDPNMENIEVMRRAFKIALQKVDPAERKAKSSSQRTAPRESEDFPESSEEIYSSKIRTQSATESAKHRGNGRITYYGKDFDRQLWQRAGSRCEQVDPKTKKRCDCTFGLQREHVIPVALGGKNELGNMQLLCRAHNLLRARTIFGNKKINRHQQRGRSR